MTTTTETQTIVLYDEGDEREVVVSSPAEIVQAAVAYVMEYAQPTNTTQWIPQPYFTGTLADLLAMRERRAASCDAEVLVRIDPLEPDCIAYEAAGCHEWQQESACGHGGGVIIDERCARCGAHRITDTWADGPHGTQGLRSVTYETADPVEPAQVHADVIDDDD